MSGKAITHEQVKLFMKQRNEGDTQVQASAKAGISERSGRRIDRGVLPKQKEPRHWRTRKDPLSEVWEGEIIPLLEKTPALAPTTLFEDLQDRHPGRFPNKLKRTFQRRVKAWKALHGPDKEVMFRQSKEAGRLGLSDFTELKEITITVGGERLDHRLYHFRLPYSGWSHVKVILGGESYTALAEGLQEALQRLNGAPKEHRTDSLSAAYKNLSQSEQEDLTERYQSLCEHYGITPTRNNRGVSHENGAVESPHGHIKHRIRQALLLRGSHDFASLDAYRHWLDGLIRRFNRRCDDALEIEREQLLPLPKHSATDYSEQVTKVTTSSTISVKRVLYSVPARLAGETLRLHIYDDRIEAYVGATLAHTLTRAYTLNHNQRARCIDYRHLIDQLVRKPQAFRYSQIRDDLLPNASYQRIWAEIDRQLEPRAACKRMVGILSLAARTDCEQSLGTYLQSQIAQGQLPSLYQLEQRFDPNVASTVPDGPGPGCIQHALSAYDVLMPASSMEVH
jgi:transposase InsO family protein